MGESKDKSGKKVERVVVRVQVDESEVVLGTLSEGKCDQMPLDLVFDREFKISHNSNSSSVFICGYRTEGPDDFYDSEGKCMSRYSQRGLSGCKLLFFVYRHSNVKN